MDNFRLASLIHEQLLKEDNGVYPDYWRGSSAGYCMRYNIFKRLHTPPVPELADARSQQLGTLGIGTAVHGFMQGLTKRSGLSIAQEDEVKSKKWDMVGHFDDVIEIEFGDDKPMSVKVLYDYKTVHSAALNYKPELKQTHRMQLGTYMYLLREKYPDLELARIMEISKDDFRMREIDLPWSNELKSDIEAYWTELNDWWDIYHKTGDLPPCTCSERLGSWFATRNKRGKIWNDYYYNEEPCSRVWFDMNNKNKED